MSYACDVRSSSLTMSMTVATRVNGMRRADTPRLKSAIVPRTKHTTAAVMYAANTSDHRHDAAAPCGNL